MVPLYALIVGGGPDVESNAAQIEGHVRFVAGLLPASARRAVLFADGQAAQASVSYAEPGPVADARRALALLLVDGNAAEPVLTRPPKLGVPLDGPARLAEFRRVLAKLADQAGKAPAPLLLYFAGHGTQNEQNEADTAYDLWDNDTLKVRSLAAELVHVPKPVPVVLVMAQCFSGAFADVLFRGGEPDGPLAEREVAGFFSTRKDREAAGCSYATERADYQDFSSYFFGALCGRDRFGGAIRGADYDDDGGVSLHEAFCYALLHDGSADTPVCTSDAFLKRFAPLADAGIFDVPYREACQTATAAQRAVLDGLSEQLGLTGEARALDVYDRLTFSDPVARPALVRSQNAAKEKLDAVRQAARGPVFQRWPALRWDKEAPGYQPALDGAAQAYAKDPEFCRTLLEAGAAHDQADGAVENEEGALQRFANLYEAVVEARALRAEGKADLKASFERLWKLEQVTLPVASR